MFNKILLKALTLAVITYNAKSMALEKRRFDQEKPAVLQEISDLNNLAKLTNGRFAQIHGGFISTLLGGADACARYPLIDEIITLCKANNCENEGIAVARKLAALEKNFNPFAGENAKPAFCNNAALPASPEVRCIVPVIDPAFPGASDFNQKAQDRTGGNAELCNGQSVQEQAIALGISGCIGCTIGTGNGGATLTGTETRTTGAPTQTAANDALPTTGTLTGTGTLITGAPTQTATNVALPTDGTLTATGTLTAIVPTQTATKGALTPTPTSGTAIQNANQFTGALLGAPPVVVSDLGANTLRRFNVLKADGSLDGDFINRNGAIMRACVNQMNECAAIVNRNGGTLNGMTIANCTHQQSQCHQANGI